MNIQDPKIQNIAFGIIILGIVLLAVGGSARGIIAGSQETPNQTAEEKAKLEKVATATYAIIGVGGAAAIAGAGLLIAHKVKTGTPAQVETTTV